MEKAVHSAVLYFEVFSEDECLSGKFFFIIPSENILSLF